MSDKIIGFTIQVRGTDSEVAKLGDLKREIIEIEKQLKKYEVSTKNNSSAQAAAAVKVAALETNLKLAKKAYNEQQKAIMDNSTAIQHAAGSYNALVEQNRKLVAEFRALSPLNADQKVRMDELSVAINANTVSLTAMDSTMGRHQRNVGNYTGSLTVLGKGIKGLTSIVGLLGNMLGINTEALHAVEIIGKEVNNTVKDITAAKKAAAAATTAETTVEKAKTVATTEATVAQRIYNAVKNASLPIIGLVLLAVGALIGIMAAYKNELFGASAAEIKRQTAMDGTIIKNDELRKSHNDSIKTIRDLQIEYKLLNGDITESEASIMRLNNEYSDAMMEINAETQKNLSEVTGFWKTAWNAIEQTSILALFADDQDKEIEEVIRNSAQKQFDLQKEILIKKRNQKAKEDAEANAAAAKAAREFLEQYTKDQKDLLAKQIADAKKRAEELEKIFLENQKRILTLSRQLVDEQLQITFIGSTLETKQVQEKYKRHREDLTAQLIVKKNLSDQEVEINRLTNEKIKNLEILEFQELNKIRTAANKKALEETFKHNDAMEQIAILEIRASSATEEEKQKQVRQVQLDAAQKKLELLRQTGDQESDEVKKQIAELKLTIAELTKPDPELSPLASLLGLTDEQAQQVADAAFAIIDDIQNKIFERKKQDNDRDLQMQLDRIQAQGDGELEILKNRLESGQISEQQFRQEKERLDAELEARKIAAARAAFEENKKLAIKQVGIDLALQLMKIAINSAANPANAVTFGAAGISQNAILAGIAVANAAVQTAFIASQKFKLGGIVKGEGTGTSDSVLIRASRGEAVMNERSTSMFGPLLSELNAIGGGRRFAKGGVPLPNSAARAAMSMFGGSQDLQSLASAIIKGFNDKKVFMVEKEVTDMQNTAKAIETDSSF